MGRPARLVARLLLIGLALLAWRFWEASPWIHAVFAVAAVSLAFFARGVLAHHNRK